MKLIRMSDRKIGLLVLLPRGLHVVDIVNSLSVFSPHDPLANGLLNGALKDGCDWSLILKHWAYLKVPLKRLATIAKACPDHPSLNVRPFTEELRPRDAGDEIVALEISELGSLEELGRTNGRMEAREIADSRVKEVRQDPRPTATTAQIIEFSLHRKIEVPRP